MARHPLAHEGGGDDLDDGLELDESMLASDDEGGADAFEEADEAGGWMTDEEEEAPSRKRGREGEGQEEAAEGEGGEEDEKARKKRRREKDKARRAAKRALANGDDDTAADPSTLSPDAVAALLLSSVRAALPAATSMEIDDVAVESSSILEPLEADSGDGEYAGLLARLNDVLKDAPKKPKPGCPRVLILSLSGIRCADVVRAVRGVERHGEVAKLFAKHFKLADQIKYLAKTRVAIAVGTPARVAKLLAEGALKMTPQSVVLLDIGHRDSKKRTLLTLPEVRDELWKSLFSGPARAALKPAKYAAF